MTDPDQLPAFHVPLSPTMEKAVWLSDALTAIATERARADALEAALREVLLAQENYARCHAREVNAINNYSGGQAEYSSATLKATVRVSEAERAARALLEKKT